MSENKPATITEVLADLDNERQGHVDNGYHEGITYAMSLLEDLPAGPDATAEALLGVRRRRIAELERIVLDQRAELAAEKAGHATTLESLQTVQARGTRLAGLAERHANHATEAIRQRDEHQARADHWRAQVADLETEVRRLTELFKADRDAWAATEAGLHERLDTLQVDGHTDRCAAALRKAFDERDDARKAAREGDAHLANLADAEKRAESLAKQVETLQTAMRRTLAHIGRADALLTDYVAPAGDGDQVDELERGPLLGYAINPDGSTGEPVYAAVEIRP